MMKRARWTAAMMVAAAGAIYFTPTAAHACPPGFIPNAAGTPGMECIPHNGGGGGGNTGGNGGGGSGLAWVSRWGAFAFDDTLFKVGQAGAMASQGKAKKAAIAHCRAKGGSNCKVEFVFTNHCAAMAQGQHPDGIWSRHYYSDITLPRASEGAMKACVERGASGCEISFTECAKPQRI